MCVVLACVIVQVVRELLGSSAGNELYSLEPPKLGFDVGDSVTFGEVMEVGRMLQMTPIAVIQAGHLTMCPMFDWTFTVKDGDGVVVIADLW